MTAREHAEMLRARDRILRALGDEMKHRAQNRHWVEDERTAVVVAANEWAMAHGLRLLTVDHVEQIETSAVGHIDYAAKLALYVAEALYGRNPFAPVTLPASVSVTCPAPRRFDVAAGAGGTNETPQETA